MERFKIASSSLPLSAVALTAALFVSLLIPQMESQTEMGSQTWPRPRSRTPPLIHPRPLCSSQFALANYACARLPMNPEPIPIPPPPSPPDDDQGNGGHNRSHTQSHDNDDDNDNDHHRRHGHSHSHSHSHSHHHHHSHQYSAVVEDCCRWAKAVDSECICDVLVHLPNFLSRPSHAFTIAIEEDCVVTFSCGGRIKI